MTTQLTEGVRQLQLDIEPGKQRLLLDYLQQLVKWNQAYNLSGISEADRMLTLHLLDSLTILPFIDGERILDVGTGAGLPGLPLAICLPETKVALLDSNGKKIRFLFQTCALLQINNIELIQQRVESYQSQEAFDIVLSRAFSSVKRFIEQTRHLLAPNGRLLAMKGQYPDAELHEIPEDFTLSAVHVLEIPGETRTRHLLELTKKHKQDDK